MTALQTKKEIIFDKNSIKDLDGLLHKFIGKEKEEEEKPTDAGEDNPPK